MFASFENFENLKKNDKNGVILPSSDRKNTIKSSLESPRWDALNDTKITSLASIDGEIF